MHRLITRARRAGSRRWLSIVLRRWRQRLLPMPNVRAHHLLQNTSESPSPSWRSVCELLPNQAKAHQHRRRQRCCIMLEPTAPMATEHGSGLVSRGRPLPRKAARQLCMLHTGAREGGYSSWSSSSSSSSSPSPGISSSSSSSSPSPSPGNPQASPLGA